MARRLKPQFRGKKPGIVMPKRKRMIRSAPRPLVRAPSIPDDQLKQELDLRDTLSALQQEIMHLPKGPMRDRYIHAMTEVAKDGDLSHLVELTRYVREPVALDEFLYGHAYLGLQRDELFPGVIETLEALECEEYVECVMKGAIGGGKMVLVSEPILTARGWTTMGDLQDGDKVYDDQGNLCNVVKAHRPKTSPTSYRVHFSDETYIDACADHLWYTDERTPHGNKVGSVKSTQYIADNLKVHGNNAHSIPLIPGVQSIASDVRADPYVLGVWLGDGHSGQRILTIADKDTELLRYVETCGVEFCQITDNETKQCEGYRFDKTTWDVFKSYGLPGNKHIPNDYLYGSHEQRVALLQGLMDTDGYIRPTGSCEITQKNRRLADDIMQLLWLLGLKPLRREKIVEGAVYHRITFTAHRNHVEVFRLRRKLAMQPFSGAQALRQRSRTIVAVEPIEPTKMRCITVDSPSRLYCVGRQMQVTHNTTTANLGMARQIYKISCMRNPQQTFGLQQHSSIVFTIQSVRLSTAKQAVFEEMGKFFNNSPYFREVFPYDRRITSQMRFMRHNVQVLPVSSSASGAISMNVIGGLLDEVNFMQRVEKSKQGKADENGEYNQAKELYLTLSKRRRSRFMNKGKLPGTLFLVSSSRYPDDFTEEKAAEALMCGGTDPEIYVYSKSLWESKGRDRYSPEEFTVLVGNERTRSRILGPDEAITDDDVSLIQVPEDFRGEFEKDIEGSIRDFAGQTTLASSPFIHNRESIFECMTLADEYAYQSVFPHENIDLDVSVPTPIRERIRDDVRTMRVAHADLATTGDSAGLAIGHVAGTRTIERLNPETGERTVEVLPVIAYDALVRIDPPRDGEIDFSKIRQMIIDLRDNYGLPIKVVTTDGFQCVSGDTEIWTNRGMIPARNVTEGDVVQSRIGPRPVTKKWSFGTKPALRITTKDGHSIVVTEKHKLEVSSQKRLGGTSVWQWKQAKDMQIGDILHTWDGATDVDPEFNGLTPDLARLYGLIYGDGCIGKDGVAIQCADGELWEAARIIKNSGVSANVSINFGLNRVSFSSRSFVRQMLEEGFDKQGIPSKLKEAPIAVQSAFLSGLFAADGTVKSRDGQPSLSTKNVWLADYVRNFLRMAHGIATHTTVVDRAIDYSGTYNTDSAHQYIISVKGSRLAFHDKVGFAYEAKQMQLAEHTGVEGRRIGSAIVSIEPCEADVYDFEVEEDHAYLANGIVSHNSTDFRQILAKKGFVTDYLSLDRTTQPYRTFRDALYDKRIILPRHQTLVRELTELELLRKNNKEKVDHKPRGCFTGNTEIVLADSTTCRMDELPETFEVCAYNLLQQKSVTADGRNPRITKEVTELVEIEMDNGKVIQCTPEHLFLLTDGTYKEAQYLTEYDDIQA